MPETPPPPPVNTAPASPPKMHLNWQDWLPLLEDENIPEAEKRQFIETLWDIVIGFVDFGWGLSSSREICGNDVDLTRILNAAVLHSKTHPKTKTEET